MRHTHVVSKGKRLSDYFALHEVYYDLQGRVVSWTEQAESLVGDSTQEIRGEIKAAARALRRPMLVVDDHKGGRLIHCRVHRSRIKT